MRKYKAVINVDRLELTYQSNESLKLVLSDTEVSEFAFGNLRLLREQSRLYSHEFLIMGTDYDEEHGETERPIGTLYFGSPNPNRQYIYLLFENAALYDEYLLASRFYVESVLGLEFLRVSKIDIAVDFNFNVVNRFYRLFKNPDYDLIINGKKVADIRTTIPEVMHIAGNTNRKRPFAHHMPVVKNVNGSMLMRAYDKSKEIEEESGKEYIKENAGFNRLYRLEVSLGCHKVVKKVLDTLALTDEELYSLLGHEGTLIDFLVSALNKLVRVSHRRRSYGILDVILPNEKVNCQLCNGGLSDYSP